jgi:CheY-like chemotaxis protein
MRKTKQIVYNLLSNAVKFSGYEGRVTVSARRVPRSAVGKLSGPWPIQTFPLAENGFCEFLEICVTDGGIGISGADMAIIFHAFSQIDSSLARKFEGTGLGLAMVKQLVELHGGAVAVASAVGEGSRFAVWLPVRTPALALTTAYQGPNSRIPMAVDSTQRLALIVEDDERATDLIRLLLEAEGFAVLHAASAEAALELAPQEALSLITLDIQLPGIDGWAFLMKIRETSKLASVPVVIIAGVLDSSLALIGGAAAVLQKPVSRAQLRTCLAGIGLQPVPEHTFLPAPAYEVFRAYGGSEAIMMAQELLPDLILLDLMMPELNGFDVVESLQRVPETADIPVLVVTAQPITPEDRAALSSKGGRDVGVVDKAGFDRVGFIAEVRRAVMPQMRRN